MLPYFGYQEDLSDATLSLTEAGDQLGDQLPLL